jgi:ubiquinone/menaquinone biosynthesis C-methylase UbiE
MSDAIRWGQQAVTSDWGYPAGESGHYEAAFVQPGIRRLAPKVLDLLALQEGEHVLDVACGTGVLTQLAAATVGPGGRAVGLDLSPGMLANAGRATRGLPNAEHIEWIEGDAHALPFPDASFDAVGCQLGLQFFPDRGQALREMGRVLRDDGRVAIMVWGAIERCPGQLVMRDTWARHFGPDSATIFRLQHALSDPADVRSLLTGAGFSDVSVRSVMGTVRYDSPEMLTRAYGNGLEIEADDATRQRIFVDVSRALEAYVGEDGLVYPIEAILASARRS